LPKSEQSVDAFVADVTTGGNTTAASYRRVVLGVGLATLLLSFDEVTQGKGQLGGNNGW